MGDAVSWHHTSNAGPVGAHPTVVASAMWLLKPEDNQVVFAALVEGVVAKVAGAAAAVADVFVHLGNALYPGRTISTIDLPNHCVVINYQKNRTNSMIYCNWIRGDNCTSFDEHTFYNQQPSLLWYHLKEEQENAIKMTITERKQNEQKMDRDRRQL